VWAVITACCLRLRCICSCCCCLRTLRCSSALCLPASMPVPPCWCFTQLPCLPCNSSLPTPRCNADGTVALQLTLGSAPGPWYEQLNEFFNGSIEHCTPRRVDVSRHACCLNIMPARLCAAGRACRFVLNTLCQVCKLWCICLIDDGCFTCPRCACPCCAYTAGQLANRASKHPQL